jgi:hypothetical protein
VEAIAQIQRQQVDYFQQRRDGDREARFNISRSIPKITSESGALLMKELDAFEDAFAKTNPRSWKDWTITLEDALEGKAKAWRDFVILTEPGGRIHQATVVAGATDVDYGNYYRYIRGEMFKRANVQYEDPGEASRKRWENIRIPTHFRKISMRL